MENDYSININTNEYTIEIDKEPDIIIELNEQGPPGSSGNGIDHIEVIEETHSYTKYRIVYTDQEEGYYDYIVYNGDKGDTGETGNGISSISKTGSSGIVDTYTITYTNGNETTFTVTNGSSISTIEKTSTSGLVDTYTITLTNGDTKTFTVTNGKDGADGQDGSDGYSPTATITKSGNITTISITDKDGTTTETINDGIVYQDGTGIDISNDTISVTDYNNILKNDAGPSNLGISANNNTILMDNTGNKKNLYLHFSSAQSSDIMALIYNGLITDSLLSNNIARTSDIPTTASDIGALPDTTTINDLTTESQQNAINSGANTTNIGQIATNTQAISNEVLNRQSADNNLQSQIDALVVASDVFDIVGTYTELQAYDISTVPVNDIIKVLVDSTHNNAATYYRCVENNNVKSWSYIGAEGAYYTKSEADSRFVEQTTTINGQSLSNNITLDAEDVGALPDSTTIGNGTLTIQKNGSTIDTFGANDTGNTTVNISVPTDTSDLTNNAGFITGINSSDVTTALGYTPYDSSNPSGYTSNTGTVTSVNNVSPINGNVTLSIPSTTYMCTTNTTQDISGRKTFLGEKAIWFKQSSASNKLGFTLINNSNSEVGGLEFRPNSIDGAPILTINAPSSGSTLVGFRYWGDTNIIAPKPTTTGNYYIPLQFKNGSATATSSNGGIVDLDTLIPDIATSVSSGSTNAETVGAKLFYDTVGDIETALNTINSGSST